jgi:hypothetical protein
MIFSNPGVGALVRIGLGLLVNAIIAIILTYVNSS